jgi:hypothetical protein
MSIQVTCPLLGGNGSAPCSNSTIKKLHEFFDNASTSIQLSMPTMLLAQAEESQGIQADLIFGKNGNWRLYTLRGRRGADCWGRETGQLSMAGLLSGPLSTSGRSVNIDSPPTPEQSAPCAPDRNFPDTLRHMIAYPTLSRKFRCVIA